MSQLSPETVKLHEAIIRNVKGIVTAWEKWLEQKRPPKV